MQIPTMKETNGVILADEDQNAVCKKEQLCYDWSTPVGKMQQQINGLCKELVASLIRYFIEKKDNKGPLLPLTAVGERVAAALNMNISTISTISQKVKDNNVLKWSKKRNTAKKITNCITLDASDIIITGHVYQQICELWQYHANWKKMFMQYQGCMFQYISRRNGRKQSFGSKRNGTVTLL